MQQNFKLLIVPYGIETLKYVPIRCGKCIF